MMFEIDLLKKKFIRGERLTRDEKWALYNHEVEAERLEQQQYQEPTVRYRY